MEHRNDILLQECEVIIKGKIYTLKPLTLKTILKREFVRDNIYNQNDTDGKLLFRNLINDTGKEKVNKWLKRQVSIDDMPINLEYTSKEEWEKEDIIGVFDLILEISGLTIKEESNEQIDDKDNPYMELVTNLMVNGAMTKDEIMNSSIPFLIAVSKTVTERATMSGLGMFGGMVGATKSNEDVLPPISTTSGEEFANAINDFYKY